MLFNETKMVTKTKTGGKIQEEKNKLQYSLLHMSQGLESQPDSILSDLQVGVLMSCISLKCTRTPTKIKPDQKNPYHIKSHSADKPNTTSPPSEVSLKATQLVWDPLSPWLCEAFFESSARSWWSTPSWVPLYTWQRIPLLTSSALWFLAWSSPPA